MIPLAVTEGMLRDTGGNPIDFGAASSWCHFERITIETNDRDGFGVLGKETTVLVAEGFANPMPKNGDQVTVHLDSNKDGVFDTPEAWQVRDRDSDEADGHTTRYFVRKP